VATDTISSTPNSEVDLDSPEAQALLESAFKAASPGGSEIATSPAPAPAVETTPSPTVTEAVKVVEDAEAKKVTEAIAKVEGGTPTESVASDTTQSAPTPAATPTAAAVDWAKDLPKEAQEKIQQLLINRQEYHQWRSDSGRQAALQAKLAEARREAEALRARLSSQHMDVAAKQDELNQLEHWKELLKADPNLAKAFEARLAYERKDVRAETKEHIDATVNPLYQHTEASYLEQQREALAEQVPNYQEVIKSPVYQYWINNVAPTGLRQIANTSSDIQDAVFVMRSYAEQAPSIYNHMVTSGMIQGQPYSAHQQQTQAQAPAVSAASSVADQVAQSRQERVQAAPVVTTAHNPIATSSGGSQVSSRIGDLIDIDNPAVAAMFADAYNKARHRSG